MYIQRVSDAMDRYIGSVLMADIRATDLAGAYRGLEKGPFRRPQALTSPMPLDDS